MLQEGLMEYDNFAKRFFKCHSFFSFRVNLKACLSNYVVTNHASVYSLLQVGNRLPLCQAS